MTFLHPEFLYFMLPPVAVLFYFILTQKDPVASVFSPELFARLQVREKRLSLRQRNGIYLLIFILLITAMAQPVVTEATMKVKAPVPVLTAAIDLSASMQTQDVYPSRLAVARAKLLHLIALAKRERLGVLAFGKDVYVVSPPTEDKRALRELVRHFNADGHTEKGTDFEALLEAFGALGDGASVKNLLLLSDGGDPGNVDALIASAEARHIRLYILGIGTSEGGTFFSEGHRVMSKRNPELERLAEATGGTYRTVATGDADIRTLLQTFRRSSEGGEQGVKEVRRYGQLFILPLGGALFLLLIATSSLSARRSMAVPPVVLLGALLLTAPSLRAEQFDYELLQKADRYYKAQRYLRAANAYYRYGKLNGNDPQAMYDSAHALYRAGNYLAAAALWKQIHTKERLLQFAALHNLGNAYAAIGDEAHLNAALKAYQSALYFENDPKTRENMEIVKGRLIALMQQKRKASQRKGTTSGKPDKQFGGASSSPQREKPAAASAAAPTSAAVTADAAPAQNGAMSDFEASMWIRQLQRQQQTRLYRITPPQAKAKERHDAAPW